jgi:predicted thioesterase
VKNKCSKYSFFLLFLVIVFSCSTEGNIQQLLGTSVQAPVFLDCRPVSSTEIVFKFSVPVQVRSLHLDPFLEAESITQGKEVTITFPKPLEAGRRIIADIVVEDTDRNSLNVIVPFRARNDRMPTLVFNEIRTEYAKLKVEFVEFYVCEPGNLGAIRLFIASNSMANPVYEFAPIEVSAGDYIVLHLRTPEEGCVDEIGDDLGLSGGTEAYPGARDLWIPGSKKMLQKTDVLLLMDQDDRVLDGILLCDNPDAGWGNKKDIAAAVELLGLQSAWIPNPAGAVYTNGTTNTRTISRDESTTPAQGPENWYITATSGATPGKPNNPKRYQ